MVKYVYKFMWILMVLNNINNNVLWVLKYMYFKKYKIIRCKWKEEGI